MNFKVIIGLILTICVVILIAFFVGFNLDNKANFSVVFKTLENVSVLFIFFIAFLIGVFFTLPFVFMAMSGKKVKVIHASEEHTKKAMKKQKKLDKKLKK